jgi:predicted HTH transcriptional regulator
MTEEQLITLIRQGESETLEFKRTTGESQRLVLRLLSERQGIGRKVILSTLGLELRPIKTDLEDLKRFGLIYQRGTGRGSVWYLADSTG